MPRKRKNNTGIPDFEIDSLARALLPAILGHKNTSITLSRYAHSLLEHKVEMMNRLGKLL